MADVSVQEVTKMDCVTDEGSVAEVKPKKPRMSIEGQSVGVKRRGRKITHPLKCRACGKLFTDTANRRKHEKDQVCSKSKLSEDIKKCIAHHHESLSAHLIQAYNDIKDKMVSKLGMEVYERNKFYLIDSSLNLMQRSLCSERFNIIACVETVEKLESRNARAEKQNVPCN